MTIKTFFASLLPSFERSRLTEDVDLLRKELHDNLIPSFTNAANIFKAKGFKNKTTLVFNSLFGYHVKVYQRVNYVEAIRGILITLPAKLDVIDSLIPELFAKDVTKETLTYRKMSVIRYLEAVRFVTKYSSKLLMRTLANETRAVNQSSELDDVQLTPVELTWLADNQTAFLDSIKVLDIQVKDLSAKLSDIPDVMVVPERMDVVKETVGVDKLDPLRFNFISAGKYNFIYHFRMAIAEWQVKQYEAKLEEKRVLELRTLALKKAYEGKQDARLEQQISYNEGRLQKLNYQIHKLEESHATA